MPSPPSKSTFTLLLFASAQTYTSQSSLSLAAPLPLSQLFPTLEKMYPGITHKILRSCAVSLNLEYVDVPETDADGQEKSKEDEEEVMIQPGDEVGIIPPVSSG